MFDKPDIKIAPQDLPSWVSIGIATKNRWQDLQITLANIEAMGLGALPILIFDDNSDCPCPFDWKALPLNVDLKRFAESKGYIVRRNQLAREINTKYYLSLDDDSFPVSGSIETAIEFAESCKNLLCLSFPIYNPILDEYQNSSFGQYPYQVRFFVGCGHLLHRQNFLQLGGYREELIHQGEEMEIAARAFQQGLYCYHFPALKIHHCASNAGRNWKRMGFYGARNNVLWNDWFVPSQFRFFKQSRTFTARILHSIKVGHLVSQMQGQIAGFKDISRYKANRHPMSVSLFRQWHTLPYS